MWLKICNSDIHTSICHFMEIQQKEKESLTAFIHCIKREGKRCNFTNNAATIKILVKGLKDAHTLAARIYEKGPQTLVDAISEVEKLQATQQHTVTLIPPTTVNVMCNKEYCWFQCQEAGHIASHCPNVRCFECDEYGHIVVDCLHRIPPSGTPTHCHRSPSQHRPNNRLTSHHCHESRYRCSRSRSQSHPCRCHSRGCHDSHRDCSRSHHRDSRPKHRGTSWHPHSNAYSHCSHQDTSHQRSSSHRSTSAHSNRLWSQSTYKPARKTLQQNSSWSRKSHTNTHTKWNSRVTIRIHNQTSTVQMTSQVIQKKTQTIKLAEPSLSSTLHEWGPDIEETVTVACIMDYPTITVHAGKCYKAVIDLGTAISCIRYSTYQHIDNSFKTPIQPTTAKLNTANSLLMTALGITALHLRTLILNLHII